VNLL
jgi:hypothetical protein